MEMFWICYFFMLGALLSSFMNVLGIRILYKTSIIRNSQCPKCNHKLRFIDILPIFGYIINLGKCHFCKIRIPTKYIIIELVGGFLYAISFYIFDFSFEFVISLCFFSYLIITVITLYEHKKSIRGVNYFFVTILTVLIILYLI